MFSMCMNHVHYPLVFVPLRLELWYGTNCGGYHALGYSLIYLGDDELGHVEDAEYQPHFYVYSLRLSRLVTFNVDDNSIPTKINSGQEVVGFFFNQMLLSMQGGANARPSLGLLMSKPTRVAQYAKPLLAASIPQFDYKRNPCHRSGRRAHALSMGSLFFRLLTPRLGYQMHVLRNGCEVPFLVSHSHSTSTPPKCSHPHLPCRQDLLL